MLRKVGLAIVVAVAALSASPSLGEDWTSYGSAQRHFRIDLPTRSFQQAKAEAAPGHLTLNEIDGSAVIDIYAGVNAERLTLAAFEQELSAAGAIKDITYRAAGHTWFVISGHYKGEQPLIFYAKYMFTSDARYVAGFEISYASEEKDRMDSVVQHLEKSFRVF